MKSTRDRILQTLLRQPRRTINDLAEAVTTAVIKITAPTRSIWARFLFI